jgi:galactokinase
MSKLRNELSVSTPGRVCLFGEHQDYLQLPVIASAISLRISITGRRQKERMITIDLPDLNDSETIDLNEPVNYDRERDYFKSSLNVLLREGYTFSDGFNCNVKGNIPINAGTSSSSALVVTWINFLTRMSDQSVILLPEQLAVYAHRAEVLEFSEPGGMMDHFSTAIGGIISIDFAPGLSVSKIGASLGTFVLGNSLEPKNTKYILANVKDQIIKIDSTLRQIDPGFSLLNLRKSYLGDYAKYLTDGQFRLLSGTIENRDLTEAARTELQKAVPNGKEIGRLMSRHQEILTEVLGISTPKINRMTEASLKAGAYGAKINGSGGGGCMFAYAPENPFGVKEAIEEAGGQAFIIKTDEGSREEPV